MSRILVTGGAGFIGSHLCDALLADGHDVIALDNFDDFYDPAVKRSNIARASEHAHFTLIEGDIRDANDVERAFDGSPLDAIVHLAARAGVRPSIQDPLLYQDVNVRGTVAMLELCRRLKGCRFIFASSSSVYGNSAPVPFQEDDPVAEPISPYAATKRSGELLCHTYHHLYGVPVTCLRFFTVYGPRQRPDLAIHKFAGLIERGRPVPVFGDGSMERDFTYVDDIVDGVCRTIERCDGYQIYNLGNAEPVSVLELIGAIERALGKRAIIEHRPPQPGDVTRTFADITRARCDLGYNPLITLSDGLGRFAAWLRRSLPAALAMS